jgi:hypothetical protein
MHSSCDFRVICAIKGARCSARAGQRNASKTQLGRFPTVRLIDKALGSIKMHAIDKAALYQWLGSSLIWFFLFWGVVAVAVGVGLIVCSNKTLKFFDAMNRYVSTRHGFKPMAVIRDTGGVVRRYRIWIAALFIAGAAYSLFGLLSWFDGAAIASRLRLNLPPVFIAWILESVRLLLIVGCAFAFVIGLMLAFFPQAVDALEARVNKWYSFRNISRGADTMHLTLDNWVAAFPRTAGGIIVVTALFVVIDAVIMLLRRT